MKSKKYSKTKKNALLLIWSIAVPQIAGFLGSIFTISSIPTWYAQLNKPTFSPPNWIFGPVWTTLFLLMGISLYRLSISKSKEKGAAIKIFYLHLVLNIFWSILFFGLKNPGLAFLEIIILWTTILYMILTYAKIDKLASLLLIPYLLWVSFASFLNFNIWKLNQKEDFKNVFAQEFSFKTAYNDFIFTQDKYKASLADYNSKKDSYQKNPTLSLKEEARISLYSFLNVRNEYIKAYLTVLRMKVLESNGLTQSQKENLYSKIDPEVLWYEARKQVYSPAESVENLINKSKEEDSRYETNTLTIIRYSLGNISLGYISDSKNKHLKIYEALKEESQSLVKLGRADTNLFERWYKDIDQELNKINDSENKARTEVENIVSSDKYLQERAYDNSIKRISPIKTNLLTLNRFISELENVISEKR